MYKYRQYIISKDESFFLKLNETELTSKQNKYSAYEVDFSTNKVEKKETFKILQNLMNIQFEDG